MRPSHLHNRTPIRRLPPRPLRPARSFSTSHPTSARHNGDNDSKRPAGLLGVEWMQQKQYTRWKKRVERDPFRALFGGSDDRLRGRGLAGMEWVRRRFPGWMVEEMGLRRVEGGEAEAEQEREEKGYPRKVVWDDNNLGRVEGVMSERERLGEAGKGERVAWSEGVASPSDSRRPRDGGEVVNDVEGGEAPKVRYVDRMQGMLRAARDAADGHEAQNARVVDRLLDMLRAARSSPYCNEQRSNHSTAPDVSSETTSYPENNVESSSKDWRQSVEEDTEGVIPEIKRRRRTDVPVVDVTAKTKNRHATAGVGANSGVKRTDNNYELPVRDEKTGELKIGPSETLEPPLAAVGSEVPNKEQADEHSGEGERAVQAVAEDSVVETGKTGKLSGIDGVGAGKYGEVKNAGITGDMTSHAELKDDNPKTPATPRRSPFDVVEQLPKDDLDFLSADHIRASMGRTKGVQEDTNNLREKLEQSYKRAQRAGSEIDPMLEAKVVNDQYVRRKAREMTQPQERTKIAVEGTSSIKPPVEPSIEKESATPDVEQRTNNANSNTSPVSVLETSLDFMSRWLHTGGNVLAQHFWQDPVEVVAGQAPGADNDFLKGISVGVMKGRRALASIKEALIVDFPATQPLVSRLNRDEVKASVGAAMLYKDLPSAMKNGLDSEAAQAAARVRVGKLRQALLDTDKEFKVACESIDTMESTTKPSQLLEKRLRMASDVLQKNTKLTRMAIFGLQARIQVEAMAPAGLLARELLHRLFALQDTQLALSRLVARAMLVLGIKPEVEEELAAKNEKSESTATNVGDPTVMEALAAVATKGSIAKHHVDSAAADAKLEDEVDRLQAAMRGLSDGGYARPPKPVVPKSFDGPNPLAHSLFRPFGLQLESLGKEAEAAKESVVDAAKKEKGDKELVREMKKAYEDVHGTITVDHRQATPDDSSGTDSAPVAVANVEPASGESSTDSPKQQSSVQMLKEDAVSPSVLDEASKLDVKSTSEPEDNGGTKSAASKIQMLKEDTISPSISDEVSKLDTKSTSIPKDDFETKATTPEANTTSKSAPIEALSSWDSLFLKPSSDTSTVEMDRDTKAVDQKPVSTSTISTQATTTSWADDHSPIALPKQTVDKTTAAEPSTISQSQNSVQPGEQEYAYDEETQAYVPISYKTLIYDAQTDKLSIATSQVPYPHPPVTPIPLHEALSTLSHPAKFLDHLPERFYVIGVKPDVLTLRTASSTSSNTETNYAISTDASKRVEAEESEGWKRINPVDGTTTLSPTGFVGVGSDLEREVDFQERRSKAEEFTRAMRNADEGARRGVREEKKGGRGRVGFGGVMKTAIWAGAWCYVVGVLAELVK